MSHIRAYLAPFCVNASVCELNEVDSVLNEALELVHFCMRVHCGVVLELACHTAADHRKWLGADLLREEEVLIEAESV